MTSADEPAPPFDQRAFRDALGRFATGVTVVTCAHEAGVHGMTANAFASVSLDPPLVLVVVDHRARLHGYLQAARRFGVSVLAADQEASGWHFAGHPQPPPLPEFAALDGAPVLADGLARFACDLWSSHPGGDHTIFVGRVTALRVGSGEPLLFYRGHFHPGTIGPLPRRAGEGEHAEERPALEAWR